MSESLQSDYPHNNPSIQWQTKQFLIYLQVTEPVSFCTTSSCQIKTSGLFVVVLVLGFFILSDFFVTLSKMMTNPFKENISIYEDVRMFIGTKMQFEQLIRYSIYVTGLFLILGAPLVTECFSLAVVVQYRTQPIRKYRYDVHIQIVRTTTEVTLTPGLIQCHHLLHWWIIQIQTHLCLHPQTHAHLHTYQGLTTLEPPPPKKSTDPGPKPRNPQVGVVQLDALTNLFGANCQWETSARTAVDKTGCWGEQIPLHEGGGQWGGECVDVRPVAGEGQWTD